MNLQLLLGYMGGTGGGPSPETPIEDVQVTLSRGQYTNRPINVAATPLFFGTVTNWRWEVRRTSDDAVVAVSASQNPSFSIGATGYYDLYLYASNTTDYYTKRYRRAFRVFNPKLTDAEVLSGGGRIIDVTPGDILYYDYTGQDMSDKVIRIKGTSSTAIVQLHNLTGTAGHPAIIDKADDNVQTSWICRGTSPHAFWLSGTTTTGCRYVTVNGFNQDGTSGMKVSGNNASTQVVYVDGKFTDIELTGFEVTHFTNQDAAAVAMQPMVGTNNNIDNWYCDGLQCYKLDITNAGEEGIYLLESNQSPGYIGNNGFYPPSGRNGFIAWCTVNSCGRDAYQWGCWLGYEVHNNFCTDWAIQADPGGQEAAFAHNGGSAGAVFENIAIGGKYFYNLQSGLIPWDKQGGETTPRPSVICNNVFSKGSYVDHGDPSPFCFYGQNSPSSGAGTWNVYVTGNIFDTNKKVFQITWANGGFFGNDWKFVNNLLIKNGNATTGSGTTAIAPELEFQGDGRASTTGTVVNNLVREMGSDLSDLLFTNYAAFNYKPTDITAASYSGSPTNLDSYSQFSKYIQFDVENFPARIPGYYFGAYSLYGKRVVSVPAPADPVAPSYTVGPTVTPTMTGAGVTSTTNKTSLTYWTILANNAPVPSYDQIMNGANAITFGNYMGTPAGSATITGLMQAVAYDYHYFAINVDGVKSAITKIDFTTVSDVTAPTLSGFAIPDANKTRVTFNSSEVITGTTFGGFTITGKTISSLTINAGQTTGHYFTVSVAFGFGDAANIAYSGSGSNIQDGAGNALATIGSTAITNNIAPAVAEKVIWGYTNVTNSVKDVAVANIDDITSTSTDSYSRSTKAVGSTDDGNIYYQQNGNSKGADFGSRFGFIDTATGAINSGVVYMSLALLTANSNVDWTEGVTYAGTASNIQDPQRMYRFEILRSTNKIRFHSGLLPSGQTNPATVPSWTLHGTYTGTIPAVALKAAFRSTVATRGIYNAWIQANRGLI